MPPPEGAQIIRVILPSSTEVDAYYDRSTTPGNWRTTPGDHLIMPGGYAGAVPITLADGSTFVAYWNAAEEQVWRAVDGPDEQLTPEEVLSIVTIDLRP